MNDAAPHADDAARMRARAAQAAREAREAAAAAHEELAQLRAELDALRQREAALERAARNASGARRIVFLSGEPDTPGHLYRVERPAEAARAAGASVLVLRQEEVGVRLDEIAASDVLLIWRAAWDQNVATAVAAARAGALRIVFDLDDLMVDPDLAREEIIDGIRSQSLSAAGVREHYAKVRTTMLAADFCLASTDELATHLRRHGKPTLVVPNGFDAATLAAARLAVRTQRAGPADSVLRIGYAAGSRTHQRDFAEAADALALVLRARADCRLVLFRSAEHRIDTVDLHEFPALAALEDRIEWRDTVPPQQLPSELARFDVNIAPLQAGNAFCEAKSELKYFEAALVEVLTVASATGPLRRAIDHGRTGFLAETPQDWHAALVALLDDAEARRRIGRAAYLDVLWRHGPERRVELVASVLDQVQGGRAAARAFELDLRRAAAPRPLPEVPDGETIFLADSLGTAEVCVIVPLYDYAHHVEEALESVRQQSLAALDLVVVDDCSTDDGLAIVLAWAERYRTRFNRIEVRQNARNLGLGLTRNAGFAAAETAFVLPLDADNRLRPRACERLLADAKSSGAAFVYPVIREFGEATGRLGTLPYAPARLIGVPYIDAMALVRVAAWAAVGGYCDTRLGWEDYEFWCRMAEFGIPGSRVAGEPLAEYRVHSGSMLRSVTETPEFKPRVVAEMRRRHPWLSLVDAPRAMPPRIGTPPQLGAPLTPQGLAAGLARGTRRLAMQRLRRLPCFRADEYLTLHPGRVGSGTDPHFHALFVGSIEAPQLFRAETLARCLGALPGPPPPDASPPAVVGVHVSSLGNVFMREIAEDVAACLRAAGATAEVLDETAPIDAGPGARIIVAPQEFFLLGRGPAWVRDDVVAGSVMLNTEQPQSDWFGRALPFLLASRGVIDLCPQAAALFAAAAVPSLHLAPAPPPDDTELSEFDRLHTTFRDLPDAAKAVPAPDAPFASRPVNLAFFGTASRHREQWLAQHAALLAGIEAVVHCRAEQLGPIRTGSPDSALTRIARHVAGHAKIVLNLHRNSLGYLEWHRIVRQGISAGAVVVSEPCMPHPLLRPGVHYLEAASDQLPALIRWLLTTEDGRRAAAKVQSQARALLADVVTPRATAAILSGFLHALPPPGIVRRRARLGRLGTFRGSGTAR